MSNLKIGMYASQFPVGDKDPYWNDVLALIRCDGELVDLKGNCTLVADVGYKRFTEGENHLAAYANLAGSIYSRFLINSGFDPNADWTLEYTLTPHEKTEAQVGLFPSFIGISSSNIRIISVYGAAALDYTQSIAVYTPTSRGISSQPLVKNKPLKVAIQQISGHGIAHFDGILVNNTDLLASISESPDDYYLNIFSLASGGTTGLGTIEEIRLTQAARYGLDNYVIDNPVFVQDKLPVPIYPKDPLYSDVVSLLRVQQGYLYDTKLNALTPRTTSSSVTGYYLDALKFTDASHKRVVTLTEPLAGDFTFEFTFSLDAIDELLPFEYLLRLMDSGSPQQPVVDVLRHDDEPNKLVLTGFVSESIEVTAGFNRFAMVKVGTSLKCYLNGELKTTTTLPSSNPVSEIHLSSDTNPFSGTLEELRLTKGIRYPGNYTPSEEVFPTRTGVKPVSGYLTFSSDESFSIGFNSKTWDGLLEYSTDMQNWGALGVGEVYSSGNVLYMRGSGNSYISGYAAIADPVGYAMQITATSDVECSGNIMSLLEHSDVDNADMGNAAFVGLFAGQDKLTTAPELPSMSLTENCYRGMFYNCINLTVAPELPATVLAESCYMLMLYGTGIAISETQTGTPWRIPSTGTIESEPTDWNTDMLVNTSGTFIGDPSKNTTYYQVGEPVPDPEPADAHITFTGNLPFKLYNDLSGIDGIIEYSVDKINWAVWNGDHLTSQNNQIFLRGIGGTTINSILHIGWDGAVMPEVSCTGNIMTLLDYNSPDDVVMGDNCFNNLFYQQTALIEAPDLPATTLSPECYYEMFYGTSIVSAPDLPATTLASKCYFGMFSNCTSLTVAPELPATTLVAGGYSMMFYMCTSLITPPTSLPALILAVDCYELMFYGCTAMTSTPNLPATTLANYCYSSMFEACSALTRLPELPATTLAFGCYSSMFRDCIGIKVSLINSGSYTLSWRIPLSGTIGTDTYPTSRSFMLRGTGGTFTDDPAINTTYYQTN